MRRTRTQRRAIQNRTTRAGQPAPRPPHHVDPLLERLEPRQLLATITWDGGPAGTGTDWSDPVNWVGDVLPGALDDALINAFAGPAIQINGAVSIRSVSTAKSLIIAGSLNVTDASLFTAPVLLSGTLSGTGDCTFTSTFTWTGGVLAGPAIAAGPVGRVIINAAGTLAISGTTHDLNRTIENNGSATWTSGPIRMAGGTFNNNSQFIANAAVSLQSFGSSGVNAFNNIGTFTKLGAGETAFSVLAAGVAFNSLGAIILQEGMLTLAGGGSMSTPLSVSPGAAFTLGDTYTFTGNGSITGSGAVHFTGGTHSLPAGRFNPTGPVFFTGGAVTISTPFTPSAFGPIGGHVTFAAALNYSGDLTITGTASFAVAQTFSSLTLSGTLTGAGDVTIPGAIVWQSGTMSGAGKTHSLASGSIAITTSGAHILSRTLNSGGAAAWTGGDFAFAGGTFNNNGTFTADSPSTLLSYGNSGANTFVSNGTFTKLGAGETRFTTNITGVGFNNIGTVTVTSGQLTLGGGGSASAAFNVSASATLAFAGNYTFGASGSIAGAGEVKFSGGTINIPAGLFNPTGPMSFTGGTVTINNAVTPAVLGPIGGTVNFVSTLNYAGPVVITGSASFAQAQTFSALTLSGTLTGAGDITVTGACTWNSGTMSGAGRTIIPAAATLSIAGGATHTLSRQILSSGATTWSGGAIAMNGGTFTNNGSFLADAPTTLQTYGSGGTNAFNNAGTFTKQGVGDALFFAAPAALPFNNSGIVTIIQGTLSLGGGSTSTGIVTQTGAVLTLTGSFTYSAGGGLSGAGTVNFNGGTHTFSAGQFNTTGPLNFNGGTVTINSSFGSTALGPIAGTVLINANVSFQNVTLSGTLGGSGDVTVSGAMTWLGGSLSGTGRLSIPAAATMTISTGTHTLSKRVDVGGAASWIGGDIAFSAGTMNVLAGAAFTINSNAALQATGTGSSNAFSNAGTMLKIGMGDAQFVPGAAGVALTNTGSITIQEGTLTLGGGGTTSGSMAAALGGTLVWSAGFSHTGGSVTGAGTVTFTAGTHALTAAAFNPTGIVNFTGGAVTIGNAFTPSGLGAIVGTVTFNNAVNFTGALTITGSATFEVAQTFAGLSLSGTLGGTGDVTVAGGGGGGGGGLTWTGGSMTGTGRTVVTTGTSTVISGAAHTLARLLEVAGDATWTDGNLTFSSGTLYIRPGASLTASSTATLLVSGIDGTNAFFNQGTLSKIGSGTVRFAPGDHGVAFHNTGLATVQEGVLDLSGGGSNAGSLQVQASATLAIGASMTYRGGSISGAGTFSITAGTHEIVDSQFTPSGTVNFSGGIVTIASAFTPQVFGPIGGSVTFNANLGFAGALTVTGSVSFGVAQTFTDLTLSGTLAGAGDVTITGDLNWTGGAMSGASRTTIPLSGELLITGSAHTLSRILDVNGAATWTAGDLSLAAGTINVNPGASLTADFAGTISLSGASGINTLNNAGTFSKRGTGTLQFTTAVPGVQLFNPGTWSILAGTLSLGAGGNSIGSLSVSAGATLVFASTFNYINGGPITGGGVLTFTGGTHPIAAGQLAVTGAVNFTAGTITVSGAFAPSSLGPIGASVNFRSPLGYTGSLTITGTAIFAAPQTFTGLTLSGTLAGEGDITVTGTLGWTAGAMVGTGRTIVSAGGLLSLTGAAHSLSRTIQLAGTGSWTSGDMIFNGGRVEIYPTSVLTVNPPTAGINVSGASGDNSFEIQGRVVKIGSGPLSFSNTAAAVEVTNLGTLHIQVGAVNVNSNVSNFTSNTLTGGTWIVDNTGFLNFPAGAAIYTNNATIRLNGVNSSFGALIPLSTNAGSLTLTDGRLATFSPLGNLFTNLGTFIKAGSGAATFAFAITFNNTGSISVLGGSLTLGGPVVQVSASTLTGGSWIVAGGGALIIPGVSIATSHAAIVISGSTSLFDAVSGLRTSYGSLTITGGKTFSPASFTNLGKLTIGPGSTITVNGAFANSFYAMNHGGTLVAAGGGNSAGTFWLFQGGLLSLNGAHAFTPTATIAGAGSLAVTGGASAFDGAVTLTGSLSIATGTATFNTDAYFMSAINTGTLNLGSNKLSLTGVYTQGAAGILNIRMDSATQFGRITSAGSITLAGRLNITWAVGYTPAIGVTFNFISGGPRVGTFTTVNLGSITGRALELQYESTGVSLVVNPG